MKERRATVVKSTRQVLICSSVNTKSFSPVCIFLKQSNKQINRSQTACDFSVGLTKVLFLVHFCSLCRCLPPFTLEMEVCQATNQAVETGGSDMCSFSFKYEMQSVNEQFLQSSVNQLACRFNGLILLHRKISPITICQLHLSRLSNSKICSFE